MNTVYQDLLDDGLRAARQRAHDTFAQDVREACDELETALDEAARAYDEGCAMTATKETP